MINLCLGYNLEYNHLVSWKFTLRKRYIMHKFYHSKVILHLTTPVGELVSRLIKTFNVREVVSIVFRCSSSF